MLGPRGARRARWVGRCGEVSVPGMCEGNGGTQLGVPVRGLPAASTVMNRAIPTLKEFMLAAEQSYTPLL